MAEDQQKKSPASPPAGAPSTSASVPQSTAKPPPSTKGPALSRRAFLAGAVGASTLLTIAALSQSGGILGPLIPTAEPATVVASATDLEAKYQAAVAAKDVYTALGRPDIPNEYFAEFFYWPYTISDSPYYKNIIVRLPDDQYLGQQPTSEQYNGSTFTSTPVTSPTGGRFVAFNTTCVHLQCLVNPGYAGSAGSGQFRLQCPCHGSQYNLVDAVPVAGPAHDLGLNPLPKVQLSIDSSGNITATSLAGEPGVGRTSQ
jgi:Rieske Fe-S protein